MAAATRYGPEKVNILLVDDQPAKLLTYEVMLGELDENLLQATSAREAFQVLLRTEVAVVLVDVCMPELDGFELAAMIRQHPRFQSTAILLVSAVLNDDVDRLRGYSSGAMDYIPVPVVPELLRAKVSVFVDLWRKTRELEALNRDLESRVRERTSELETSTQRLRQSEEVLREADRHKDEFLALLAHELRNPLAPIRNAATNLILGGGADPDFERNVRIIDRQAKHLTRLVDDLLDLSRVSRGKLELKPSRVTLAEVLSSAVESSRPLIDECGHTLKLDLPLPSIPIEGDLVRLSQVFMNLLNNAAKYTPNGGRIEVATESRAGAGGRDEVVVRVRDDGVGIEPAQQRLLFEMFVRLDGADQSARRTGGGLGIGLALARKLVRLHGGDIEVRSEGAGRGSEFTVTLPVAASAQRAGRAAGAAGSAASESPAFAGRSILVVDDQLDNATSLTILLRRLGHSVETALSGAEALETAAKLRPEVVLLDIGMPEMDGFEVCRRLRAEPWGKHLFVVALSGWGRDSDRRRADDAGFDAHFVKPLDVSKLEATLARLGAPGTGAARDGAEPPAE